MDKDKGIQINHKAMLLNEKQPFWARWLNQLIKVLKISHVLYLVQMIKILGGVNVKQNYKILTGI